MTIRRRATRFARTLLHRLYPFDAWHIGHAGESYVGDIVRQLNDTPDELRTSAVEIGCGLGDILRRLRYERRLGLDRDPHALSAARVLSAWQRPAPVFKEFDFPSSTLPGIHDAIIMVNWIHEIDPDRLAGTLQRYFADHLSPGGLILIDTVADPAYTYNHDVQRLAPAGAALEHLGQYPRSRDVWVLRKDRGTPTTRL